MIMRMIDPHAIPITDFTIEDEAKLLRLNGYVVRPLREWVRIATSLDDLENLTYRNEWLDCASAGAIDDLFMMEVGYRLYGLKWQPLGTLPQQYGIALPASARELIALRSLLDRDFPDHTGLTNTPGFLQKYHGVGATESSPLQLNLFHMNSNAA